MAELKSKYYLVSIYCRFGVPTGTTQKYGTSTASNGAGQMISTASTNKQTGGRGVSAASAIWHLLGHSIDP
ncbi:hypothetical protein QTP88_003269 [Uroleucon formosanum]